MAACSWATSAVTTHLHGTKPSRQLLTTNGVAWATPVRETTDGQIAVRGAGAHCPRPRLARRGDLQCRAGARLSPGLASTPARTGISESLQCLFWRHGGR